MIDRKNKLRLIQFFLLFFGLLIIYLTYYNKETTLEQEKNSKRKFLEQENFVDWKDKNKNLLGKRYYYVFKKDELETLLPENTKIIESFYERGNWGIIIEK